MQLLLGFLLPAMAWWHFQGSSCQSTSLRLTITPFLLHFPLQPDGLTAWMPGSLTRLLKDHVVPKADGLQMLKLTGCIVPRLPACIGQLSDLQELYLRQCSDLKHLPASICQLSSLQKLDLSGCRQLMQLPASIGQLHSLQKLYLQGCNELATLPDSIGQLSSLQKLDLTYCLKLRRLPASIGQLARLEWLSLTGCERLDELPESFGQLSSLLQLSMNMDERRPGPGVQESSPVQLRKLPLFFGQLHKLLWLDLENCATLKDLSAFFGQLGSLYHLNLSGCSMLETLPDTFGQLSSLQVLFLTGCAKLKELPASIGQLERLAVLDVSGCCSLTKLPASLGQLGSLQKLDVSNCSQLQQLPATIGQLGSLHELNACGCIELKQLPQSMSQLCGLQTLTLACWEQLQESPDFSGCQELEVKVIPEVADKHADSAAATGIFCFTSLLSSSSCAHASKPNGLGVPLNFLPPKLIEQQGHLVPGKLLDQAEALQQSMSVISWISILFATACFVGFVSVPGEGSRKGKLFFADSDITAPSPSPAGASGYETNLSAMRSYFICNLLTFFFSLTTTIFCVTENMPNAEPRSVRQVLTTIRLSSSLIFLISVLGTCTFLSGVFAIYPPDKIADMIVPTFISGACLIAAFIWLAMRVRRFYSYFYKSQKAAAALSKKLPPLVVTLPRKKEL